MYRIYKKIEKSEKLSLQVVNNIKEMIKNKRIHPGEKLPNEMELAKHFGVSRPTIREALKILASINVVEIVRGKGTFVKHLPGLINDPFGLDYVSDENLPLSLYEVRKIIEPSCAKLAAERATEEEIKKLEEIVERMKEIISTHKIWVEAELEFHRIIAQSTQNPILQRIVPIIQETIIRSFQSAPPTNYHHEKAFEEHIKILEAIKNREPELAYEAMQKHMENAYNRMLTIYCKNR